MGVFFIILASLLFGSIPSVQQFLLTEEVAPDTVAFGTMAVGGILAGLGAITRKESFRLTKKQVFAILLTGIIGRGMTEIFLVTAYSMIPAGIATMVHFFFPTLVSLALVFFFHEKWTWQTGVAIFLSLAGLLGIAGNASGARLTGVLFAALSSFAFGFYYLMTEHSELAAIPPVVMLFYTGLIGAGSTAVLITARGEWLSFPAPKGIPILLICGLMGFLGFFFLNKGISTIGAGVAAFINMLEPITSVVMTILIFHSRFSVQTIIGCILIVGAMFVRAAKPANRSVGEP